MPETEGELHLFVDGTMYLVHPGESVAAALYRVGIRAWRRSRAGDVRGLFCGMGTCFDCLLTVDTVPNLRACQVLVRDGMKVETGLQNEVEPCPPD